MGFMHFNLPVQIVDEAESLHLSSIQINLILRLNKNVFLLRFGLANIINDYLRFRIRVVCVGNL